MPWLSSRVGSGWSADGIEAILGLSLHGRQASLHAAELAQIQRGRDCTFGRAGSLGRWRSSRWRWRSLADFVRSQSQRQAGRDLLCLAQRKSRSVGELLAQGLALGLMFWGKLAGVALIHPALQLLDVLSQGSVSADHPTAFYPRVELFGVGSQEFRNKF